MSELPISTISILTWSAGVIEPATFGQQTHSVHFRARAGLFEDNPSETLFVLQSDCGLTLSPLLEVDAVIRIILYVDHRSNPDCRLHINLNVSVCMSASVYCRFVRMKLHDGSGSEY